MATTTVPEVTKKAAPVNLTANAVAKVKEIMAQQNPVPAGLRIGVVGGGCSGFSYSMQFENGAGMMDKTFEWKASRYSSTRPRSCTSMAASSTTSRRWKARASSSRIPNVKSTCGCGSSFSV